ncbi:DUF1642 domain-containing protein [Streptococcus mitis]|uniref:DUF1642 domain-containing protein n=1 Tax=Streptococcus mitis TaxID=28037 RepID=UPI001CBAAD81|nr:DUF1642 domain-containing protein [Streptococcus mitis]MBZ2106942.1 DUF1642 domain-containing protein [Streptococcus mitis]MBZ2114738.1 DUF1642 domain-containing protein [Streptococcus mitis]DAN39754.1 MAG TPA: Protein of unknown function (DUF1642) [Caudoviricetes sp.]
MKVQQLIDKYGEKFKLISKDYPYDRALSELWYDIKNLDEPRKVKVKKFVADWYEEHKDEFEYNVWDWLSSKSESGKIDSKFAFWLNDVDNTPIQTLVNMHQFGYEVDEEKRYLVKMKGMSEENTYLTFRFGHTWMLSNFEECEEFRLHHTRKELEDAGFSWVFDCPGVEVQEVE